jgi:thiamine transport system ATP-binding protein
LRAIAGLEPLSGGAVTWQGTDLASVAVHQRGIGLMFQDHALFPHRNVADNVAFGLKMQGFSGSQRSARTAEILSIVGLEGFEQRSVATLSGGQAQRVALARALAPEPALLLLDEPLGSLDRVLREHLLGEIRSIIATLGITAIHVTHDHDEAISIADRLVLMSHGRLVADGMVPDLLQSPGNVQTAEALGIETVLLGPADQDHQLPTPFGPVSVNVPAGNAAAVLVRPSDIQLAEGGVAATVVGSRYRGDTWLLSCRLDDGTAVALEHPTRLQDGVEVWLVANLDRAIELDVGPAP